jgi:hypothetical protein
MELKKRIIKEEINGQKEPQMPVYDKREVKLMAPQGTEFQVNTYTNNEQRYPSITGLNDGGFVMSWMSSGQDGSLNGVYAQIYNADGTTKGNEFQVNTYTNSEQRYPSITGLNDGGFVVSWTSYGHQDGSFEGIYAQVCNADGTKRGSEFQVNTYTPNNQEHPSITSLNDGGFVVSWMSSSGQDGDLYGVYAQMYNADGTKQGGEFQVNTHTTRDQKRPSITGLNDGGFFVSWSSYLQDGSYDGVYAQIYNADGTIRVGEFQVNTNTFESQASPSITSLNDGGFVVSWQSYLQDGSGFGIYTQIYNADGTTRGGELQVNSYTDDFQSSPSITGLNDSGFVVSWMSNLQDGSGYGVYAQIYNADGTIRVGEFQVNTYTDNNQMYPSITSLNDGGFVVSWESSNQDGSNRGIFGQRFDVNGNKIELHQMQTEFQVNSNTDNRQMYPSITRLNDGGFVVSWQSFGQDGSGNGIYAQIYNADGTTKGGEFLVNTYITDEQTFPSITGLNDGGFVVSWQSRFQDGSNYGVYAQIYNADGTTRGGEFQVNTYTPDHQQLPSITGLNDGGFVVSWHSNSQDGSLNGVYAQIYNADGTTRGGEFLVNTYVNNHQYYSSITGLNDGGFVVSWESYFQDSSLTGIYAQIYNADGTKRGVEFQVNTYTTNDQMLSSITGLNDGGFVVSWHSNLQDGSNYGVYAQIYNANGTTRGGEFLVNTYITDGQMFPSITSLNDGGFVVSWQSNLQDHSGTGVYAQIYDADGTIRVGEFLVNTNTTDYQRYPSITGLNDGGFVVSWDSEGQDGSLDGIFAQRFTANGTKIALLQIDPTLTQTLTQTETPTLTETKTETPTLTKTETETATLTETETKTETPTLTETKTETPTLTKTETETATLTETLTETETETATLTQTETSTETLTPTETSTETLTQTETSTETLTPTETSTETLTQTETSTETLTQTDTLTLTETLTLSETPTLTPTETLTPTVTPTVTPFDGGNNGGSNDLDKQIIAGISGGALLVIVGLAYAYKKSKWFSSRINSLGRGIASLFGAGKDKSIENDIETPVSAPAPYNSKLKTPAPAPCNSKLETPAPALVSTAKSLGLNF